MVMNVVPLILLFILLAVASQASAATLYLKSGKKVEGQITEENDKYIKMDFSGASLTFYRDEIDKIENGSSLAKGQLEEVYKYCLDAFGRKSLEDVKKCMLKQSMDEVPSEHQGQFMESIAATLPKNLKNVEEIIEGDKGTLKAVTQGLSGDEQKVTISFKKDDGVWKMGNDIHVSGGSIEDMFGTLNKALDPVLR